MSDVIKFILERYEDGTLTAQKCISLIRAELKMPKGVEDPRQEKISEGNPADWPRASEVPGWLKLEDMELSFRTLNVLTSNGITTAKDAVELGAHQMLRFQNFGRKSLHELGDTLKALQAKDWKTADYYINARRNSVHEGTAQ